MSANDSILSSTSTAANNQQGIARALTGVVSTQETLARQYSILQTQLSSTKEEIRRDLNDLKNEVHRMGERTDRIVTDLIAAHAKQCEDLHSVISAQMSRLYIGGPVGGGVPSMAHQPQQQYTSPQQQRPSQPMQAYANAMTAAQMFGGGGGHGGQGGTSQQQLQHQQQQAAALEYASLVENFMAQAQIAGTPQNAVMRAAQQQQQDAMRVATAAAPPPPPAQQPPLHATSSTNIAAPSSQNTQISQTTAASPSSLSFLSKPQSTAQPFAPAVAKIESPISSFSTPTANTPMPIGAAKPSLTQGMPTGIGAPLQQSTPLTAGNAAKPIVPSFFAGFGNKTAFNTAPSQPAPALSFGSIKKAEDVKKEVKEEEDDEEDRAEEYEPDVHFAPVIPLPEKVAVVTGEEEEKVEFEEKCKMYRYENKEWKERAIGILKVLSKDGKFRVVMRRDQVHKVAANFPICAGLRVSPLGANEKAVQWKCTDFAEAEDGIGKTELLSVRFAGPATAKEFMELVNGIANGASPVKDSDSSPKSESTEKETKTPAVDNFDKFKPKPGSWDCPGCYTNCGEDVEECPCCNTRRDGTVAEKNPFNKPAAVAPASAGPAKFSFGFGSPATSAATPSPSAATTSDKPKASFLQAAAAATAAAATGESGTTTTQTLAPKAAAFGASLQSATSASPSPVSFSFAPKPTASSSLGSDSSTPSKQLFSFKTPDPSKPSTSMFGGSTKLFGQSSLTPVNLFADDSSSAEEKSESSAAKPTTSVFGSTFGSTTLSFASFAKGGEAKTSIFNSAEKQDEAKKQFANLPKSKPFGSTAAAAPPPKEKEDEEAGGDDEQPDDYEPNVEFKPVVPLPDLIDVVTGEENEEVKFTHRAKLYRFVRETKENKERGVGDIKLLYNPQTKKYRVVMRREQVHKICANFPILADTKVTPREGQKNVLSVMVTDFSELAEGTVEVFLIKFKSEEQANLLVAAIVDAQKDLIESSA